MKILGKLLLAVLVLAAAGVPAPGASATLGFHVLEVPGAISAYANAINNNGQIVGTFDDGLKVRGFLYDAGACIPIEVPGATRTEALGINDAGVLVGYYVSADGGVHGFVRTAGQYTSIDISPVSYCYANCINNAGIIAGSYLDSSSHGFLWNNGGLTEFNVPGMVDTEIWGINGDGWLAGSCFEGQSCAWHGFQYDGQSYTLLDFPEAAYTLASGINSAGTVVGSYADDSGVHGFSYAGGSFTPVDFPAAGAGTALLGLNDGGQMVGYYYDAGGTHAFLAVPGTGQYPLPPVPGGLILGFGAGVPCSSAPHCGADYDSGLGNEVLSLGAGQVLSATTPKAQLAGSLNPKGAGPVIWVAYSLASGEPVYVCYGLTASSWTDSSQAGPGKFRFKCRYFINWQPGDLIRQGEVVGLTAPFYQDGELQPRLHLGVFKPKKDKKGKYYPPPKSGWDNGSPNLASGDFLDPEYFLTTYRLAESVN